MINLTQTEYEKIRILDKLFASLSVDDLKSFTESEQIISRLKGTETNANFLEILVSENHIMSTNIMNLTAEVYSLKNDIQALIKALNMSVYGYNQEFNNLKQKHYIY